MHGLPEFPHARKLRFLRPSKGPREYSLNILHCATSLENFNFFSELTVYLPTKVDSRISTGVEELDLCRKRRRNGRKQKPKIPGLPTCIQHLGNRQLLHLCFPKQNVNQKEITGALMKLLQAMCFPVCLSEPHRHTGGGRKEVICPGL